MLRTVFAASDGQANVSWAVPPAGRFPVLPLAALVGGEISVVFMREGHIVGCRPMGIQTSLVGLPTLVVDRDLYLYLAWAQPDPAGYANLQLVGRKVSNWSWVRHLRSD